MNLNIFCYLLLALAAVASALLPHPLVMWFLFASVLTFVIYGGDKKGAGQKRGQKAVGTMLWAWVLGGAGSVGDAVYTHRKVYVRVG